MDKAYLSENDKIKSQELGICNIKFLQPKNPTKKTICKL